MRLYSSTLLTWPQVLHLFQAGRLYPGRWNNYYFYKVLKIDPVLIYTHSPLSLLQENRPYYCYNKYRRDILSEQGNKNTIIKGGNTLFYPASAVSEDIIVIHEDSLTGFPSFTFPNYYEMS